MLHFLTKFCWITGYTWVSKQMLPCIHGADSWGPCCDAFGWMSHICLHWCIFCFPCTNTEVGHMASMHHMLTYGKRLNERLQWAEFACQWVNLHRKRTLWSKAFFSPWSVKNFVFSESRFLGLHHLSHHLVPDWLLIIKFNPDEITTSKFIILLSFCTPLTTCPTSSSWIGNLHMRLHLECWQYSDSIISK